NRGGCPPHGLPLGTRKKTASCEPAASCCLPYGVDREVRHRRRGRPCASRRSPPRRHYWHFAGNGRQPAPWVSSHPALLPGAGRLHVNVGWAHPRPVAADDGIWWHGAGGLVIGACADAGAFLPSALTKCTTGPTECAAHAVIHIGRKALWSPLWRSAPSFVS